VERRISRAELSKELLTTAFKMLDQDNKGSISRESVMAVMLILNQDVPEIHKLSTDERSIIFAFLDRDGSSNIDLDEFLDFGKILLLDLAKKSDYATFVEIRFPRVNQSNWYQGLCKFVKSTGFEYALDVVLVLNAVIIAFQDYPMLSGQDVTRDPHYNDGYIDTIWELMETIFTVVYVLEAMLKIMVEGWKRYSESPRNMFDFSITLMAVLASAYVYCKKFFYRLLLNFTNFYLADISFSYPFYLHNPLSRSQRIQQFCTDPVSGNGKSSSARTYIICY
jgi:hypothetical protein